jgi:Putative auto-transporter adhesin, head GIN domain
MKKSILFVLSCIVGSAIAFSQSRKAFNLKDFEGLEIGSAFNIEVTQGNFKIVVEGSEEDLNNIEATVIGGKLRIRHKDTKWSWTKNRKNLNLMVSMPTIKSIDFSGATNSTVSGFSNLDVLDLDLSGASKSNINLTARKINFDVSGATSLTLNGKAQYMTGEVSGASHIKATNFEVSEANIDASGASNIKVYVTQNLKIEASGASSIRYRGRPRNLISNTSGASSVKSE